jgi:hypothetical protein
VPIFGPDAKRALKGKAEQSERAPASQQRLPPARKHPVWNEGKAERYWALDTRAARLEWLVALVNGQIFETHVKYNKITEEYEEYAEPAPLALRQRAVELIQRVEGDITEKIEITEGQTGLLLALPDNGRAHVLPAGVKFTAALPVHGTPENEIEVLETEPINADR